MFSHVGMICREYITDGALYFAGNYDPYLNVDVHIIIIRGSLSGG